jgi:hypothetical protein
VTSEESTTPDLLNRRAIESAARRDWDAAMTPYGPDSVWDASPLGIGTYRGVATIRSNTVAFRFAHPRPSGRTA